MSVSCAMTMQFVQRASGRSAAAVHEELKRGLGSLATIAAVAPLLGFLGSLWGIATAFPSCGGGPTCLGALAENLSRSMWYTALGIAVGLFSLWCYRYLSARLERLDREMECASGDLVSSLPIFCARFKPMLAIPNGDPEAMFGAISPAAARREEQFQLRARNLTGAALLGAWCLQAVRMFFIGFYPLASAPAMACLYVLLIFAVACVPAYGVWVFLLHRKPGAWALMGAAAALCWSLAELAKGMLLW